MVKNQTLPDNESGDEEGNHQADVDVIQKVDDQRIAAYFARSENSKEEFNTQRDHCGNQARNKHPPE